MAETTEFLYYNSWNEKYKKPFGAIKHGEEVTFTVDCIDSAVKKVYLHIHKDFGENREIELKESSEGTSYSGTYHLNEGQGLYFYSFTFVLSDNGRDRVVYYGNNDSVLGGVGQHYFEVEDIRKYQLTTYETEDYAPEWYRSGVAYHIFVDRFYNGSSNGDVINPKPDSLIYTQDSNIPHYVKNKEGEVVRWDFYGGNLKGIIKKLSYLKELGVTILYLSPIFESRSNHKYDTGDYHKIDPMFGDKETFQELIDKAKEEGIRILLDGVFNHTGSDSKYFNLYESYDVIGATQSKNSEYYDWYFFNDYPHDYEAWWGIKDVPKLNTELKEVRDFIYNNSDSVVKYWSKMGVGGWRLDVVDEVSDEFLKELREALEESATEDPVLIGEVWEDATNKISYDKRRHYVEGNILHGVMNYPFRTIILELLNGRMTSQYAVKALLNLKENYPKAVLYSNLNNFGSHDTARLRTSLQENDEKIRLAMILMFVLPGTPTIYYGDEAGLIGGEDPDNRRPFPWGKEDEELQEFVKRLVHIRKDSPALYKGSFLPFHTKNIIGIIRHLDEKNWMILLINPTDHSILFDVDRVVEEMEDNVTDYLRKHHCIRTQLSAYSFKVYTQDQLLDG